MRIRITTTLIFLFLAGNLSSQALDGVYVKQSYVRTLYPIYPIGLDYVFDDDKNFTSILTKRIEFEKKMQYPRFDNCVLIDFTLKEVKKIILKDSSRLKWERAEAIKNKKKIKENEKKGRITNPSFFESRKVKSMVSCDGLFSNLIPDYLITENQFPPFLKFGLKNVQIGDTNNIKYITAEVKPFLEDFLTPFYFKKTEVTNAEYREFIHWVRDSIVRTKLIETSQNPSEWGIIKWNMKGEQILNIDWSKKLRWNDAALTPILAEFYLPETQRYYRRKEIDTRKLIYRYGEAFDNLDTVGIYPDTLRWMHDFNAIIHDTIVFDHNGHPIINYENPLSIYYNSPHTNMYNWHPAYDNCPAVGLNINQIKAYLHWKTKMHNEANHRKGIKYTLVYELPGEMHWELAACQTQSEGKHDLGKYLTQTGDYSYVADLRLRSSYEMITIGEIKENDKTYKIKGHISPTYASSINRKSVQLYDPRLINTYSSKKGKYGNYSEPDGICGLHNNVSEWTSQVADSNYLNLLRFRWSILNGYKSKELSLLADMEKMYVNQTTSGTQLIRRANWFDERYSEIEGINAKCFSASEMKYSTVGFRYIIRIITQ